MGRRLTGIETRMRGRGTPLAMACPWCHVRRSAALARRARRLPADASVTCEQPACRRASPVSSWILQAQLEELQSQSDGVADCVMRLSPQHRESIEKRLQESDAELTRILRAPAVPAWRERLPGG